MLSRPTGDRFPAGARDFSLLNMVQHDSGATQPPTQWVPRSLSPGLKRLGCENDHSPLYSAEIKNGGTIPPLPQTSYWRGT
jgi:hypothetical protein